MRNRMGKMLRGNISAITARVTRVYWDGRIVEVKTGNLYVLTNTTDKAKVGDKLRLSWRTLRPVC